VIEVSLLFWRSQQKGKQMRTTRVEIEQQEMFQSHSTRRGIIFSSDLLSLFFSIFSPFPHMPSDEHGAASDVSLLPFSKFNTQQ
jgi:hypothetical protein